MKNKILERKSLRIPEYNYSKECKEQIWQRNYYEHIVRNEKEYLKILEYIQSNPYKWENDKYFN